MKINELLEDEQRVLEQVYGSYCDNSKGTPQNKIVEVYELSDDERWFFKHKRFISPYLFQQTLYKVRGNILPLRLNSAIHRVFEQTEILRCNYCSVGNRAVRVVFQTRDKLPLPVYRSLIDVDPEDVDSTLKTIMEADMRDPFDLREGNLVRFAVFRTGDAECAVLVTAAKIIADRIDIHAILKMAYSANEAGDISGIVLKDVRHSGIWTDSITVSIRDYWKKVLSDFPSCPRLPYRRKSRGDRYRQRYYRMLVPRDILSELNRKARTNRRMLLTILTTAWGLLLQYYNPGLEISLCMLVPASKNGIYSSASSGAFSIIPTRLAVNEGISVQKLVNAQFQQFVISSPYACFDWSRLQDIPGLRDISFNHCLSFLDFLEEGGNYRESQALPEGKTISRVVWDAHGMPMGIYFHYVEGKVSMNFLYDAEQFPVYGVESLANRYKLMLEQMLLKWDSPVRSLMERFAARMDLQNIDVKAIQESELERIRTSLLHMPLLSGSLESIQELMEAGTVVTKYLGDRISGEEIESKGIFVVDGKLTRYMDAGDGWYNLLNLVKKDDMLNELVLLGKRRVSISAEVLTDSAVLFEIPLDRFNDILMKDDAFKDRIFQHTLKELERYQRMWVQS